MISALSIVDEAHLVHDKTAIPAILKHKPDIYCKGRDYSNSDDSQLLTEKQAVEIYGGRLVIVDPGIQYSSTRLLSGESLRSCSNNE